VALFVTGTAIWKDHEEDGYSLVVDNKDTCIPLNTVIDFGILSDTHRGEFSFHTWLYDPDQNHHSHEFDAVTIAGSAHIALHRRSVGEFTQTMLIHKTCKQRFNVDCRSKCSLIDVWETIAAAIFILIFMIIWP
jgi:hypothetical protein